MSDDAHIPTDLLALLDGAIPPPDSLSPQVADNIERVRHGMTLAAAEPDEGKREWQEDQGRALGISGRMVRHWIAAARAVFDCRGREPVPTDLLEGSIKVVPENVEKFLRGERQPTKTARLRRWRRRASTLLATLDQAGTLAARLDAAEEYLVQVTAKVEALRKGKDHADAQPQLRRRELKDMPFVLVPWRGPSMIDGQPIRVMLSCVRNTSGSRKTADMVQLSLVRDDIAPSTALREGADFSVCGDCPHRTGPGGLKTCYVVVPKRAVRVPWEATCSVEADLEGAVEALRRVDVPLRVGNYGNPSAMPLSVAELLIEATRDSRGRLRHTSFEHGWRTCDPGWARFSMASVDTPDEWVEAKDLGWRTFRVKLPEEPVLPGEVVCPGAEEAGHRTQCARCLVCSGTAGRGSKDVVLDQPVRRIAANLIA